ncbi:MAG: antitoxin VapB family protein [Methanoculleus sp.]|nr:antitoxin VapB family protein [Methanoculleus sp.]
MSQTTVWVSQETKKRLAEMKRYPRETFDDVIRRLMDTTEDDEPLSDEAIRGIEESLEDIKAGRLYTLEEARAELQAVWRTK